MNFKVGDVVTLKSGGPAMTVVQLNDSGTVAVHWFEKDSNGNQSHRMNIYRPECLTVGVIVADVHGKIQ